MTKVRDVLTANKSYVEGFGDKGTLAMQPARHFVIVKSLDELALLELPPSSPQS